MTRRDAINAIPFKIATDAFKGIVELENYALNNPIQFYFDFNTGRLAAKIVEGAVEGVVNDIGTIFDWRNFKNFMTNPDANTSDLLNYGTSMFNIVTLAFGVGEAAKASQATKGLGTLRGALSEGEIDEALNASKRSRGIANEGSNVDKIGESVDDIGRSAAEGVGNPKTSIISDEMRNKILEGQRKNPNKNELIGGHSPEITNSNSNYAVEDISINADGTRKVKFTTQFSDGNLAKIKTSTLFPETWSEDKIIESIKTVGDTPSIGARSRDGATLHRAIIDGVQIEVIKVGIM